MNSPEQFPNESRNVIRDDITAMLAVAQEGAREADRLPAESMERVARWLSDAQSGWDKHEGGDNAVQTLLAHPDSIKQLQFLDRAYQTISASNVKADDVFGPPVTPQGTPLGETLGLVLVPWRQMRDMVVEGYGIGASREWLRGVRARQDGLETDEGYDGLVQALRDKTLKCRDPRNVRPDGGPSWVDTYAYLNARVREVTTKAGDGGWGVVLMQTGSDVGLRGTDWQQREYDQYGQPSTEHSMRPSDLCGAKLAETDITGGGPLEALALSAQVSDPRQTFSEHGTPDHGYPVTEYMLASCVTNRGEFSSWSTMPLAIVHGDRLLWSAATPEIPTVDARFRVCVV